MISLIFSFFAFYGFCAYMKDRKYHKERQELLDKLDRDNYLHTDYGDEILRDFDIKHGRKP
jgi:preprotein translocase subunit YajC